MTILGIGVDLVHVPRIAALISRRGQDKFAAKILSSNEHLQWKALRKSELPARVRFLAVRWCVKEAAYKALYPTLRPTWKEITYTGLSPEGHKPTLEYHPLVSDNYDKSGAAHVSVSHDGEYVYSSVLFEARP